MYGRLNSDPERREGSIGLIPIGNVVQGELAFLPRSLQEILGVEAAWGPSLPLPRGAYRAGRRQYLAPALLQSLAAVPPGEYLRILGIADVDLFAPGLNFVFGQALMGGRMCVISLARLRPSFYGLPPDETLFQGRTVKEAVHELGHTFGLEHCPDPRCVMRFSNSLADTDRKGRGFCPRCRELLDRKLWQM
ncbi:archaemetzincin family Zn-dependent metalloprotease [Candidatus Solincola sp.]|nr:archaemetzincin family Zn-dependent metalloprotease [Actinomycetota bacterium]MDI7252962.1 archaemetzincin family Zn-dependent metalloprotease [Actinomycetota bacterium]